MSLVRPSRRSTPIGGHDKAAGILLLTAGVVTVAAAYKAGRGSPAPVAMSSMPPASSAAAYGCTACQQQAAPFWPEMIGAAGGHLITGAVAG